MKIFLYIIVIIILVPFMGFAEILFPTGYNFLNQYNINTQSISSDDTLIITRTIVNNESFSLTGLFFSEHIPEEFNLIDHSVTKNGNSISYIFDNTIFPSYPDNNCFYWIVDDPNGEILNSINPGDNLTLITKYTCSVNGNYTFPLHSSSFYGNSTGFYSTANSLQISVSSEIDVTPPARVIDLEAF